MSKIRILVFCVLCVLVAFLGTASSDDSVKLKYFKCFKGLDYSDQFIEINLVTAKRARVLITVTKHGQILEYHRLVVGSKGIVEGPYKGAKSWTYIFPGSTEGNGLDLDIFVRPLAGGGSPVRYEIRTLSAEDKSGFSYG